MFRRTRVTRATTSCSYSNNCVSSCSKSYLNWTLAASSLPESMLGYIRAPERCLQCCTALRCSCAFELQKSSDATAGFQSGSVIISPSRQESFLPIPRGDSLVVGVPHQRDLGQNSLGTKCECRDLRWLISTSNSI